MRLITRTDIAKYKQISKTADNTAVNLLNQFIDDAQFADLQPLMGSEFYNDFIRNYENVVYQALLNGGDYEYNGITYTNQGLIPVLVHYAHSRYVLYGSQIDTPFSYIEKLNNDGSSRQVSTDGKKNTSKMSEQLAFNYWESVKLFLDRNSTDYPLWVGNCNVRGGGFRISKIGGSSHRSYDPYLKRYI